MSESQNQLLLDSLDNSIESKNKIKSVLETHRKYEMEGKTFNDYGDILENIFSNEVYKIDLMKSITIDIVYFVPGKGLQHIKQSVEQMYDDGVALNKIDLNQPILKNNIRDVEETKIDVNTDIKNYNPHLIFDGFISPYFIDENNILDFSTRILVKDYDIEYYDEICIGALYKNFNDDRFYFTTSTETDITPGTITTRVFYYKILNQIQSNIKLYWCNKSTNFEFKLLIENNNETFIASERVRELIFDFTYNTDTKDTIFYMEYTDNISLGKEEKFEEEFTNYLNNTVFDLKIIYNLFFGNQQITENTKIGNNFGNNDKSFRLYNQFLIPKTNKKQILSFYNNKSINWNEAVTKCYVFPDNVDFIYYKNNELSYAVLSYDLETTITKEFALFVNSNIRSIVLPKHPDYIFIKQNYDLVNVEFLNIETFYSRQYPIEKKDFFEYKKVKHISIKKLVNSVLTYAEFRNFFRLIKLILPINYSQEALLFHDKQYDVNFLDDNCFENCYDLKLNFWNYNLVTSFGNYCFKGCSFNQVKWFDFAYNSDNNNLITIGTEAFASNHNLLVVNLLCLNLDSIGEGCFENCYNLTQVFLNRSHEKINEILTLSKNCFKNCYNLEVVATKNKILSKFEEGCFENCVLLDINTLFQRQHLNFDYIHPIETFGFEVLKIGNNCFKNNKKTVNLEIKNLLLLTSFGEGCFACKNLNSIVLDNLPSLTSIDFSNLFINSFDNIKSIIINDFIKLDSPIDLNFFINLEEIIITNCPKITDITIINTIKLRKVDFQGTSIILKPSQFYNCIELTSVMLNIETTIIPDNCFQGCTKLSSFSIPNCYNLESFGNNCFQGCTSLCVFDKYSGKLIFKNLTNLKTIGDYCFDNTKLSTSEYVNICDLPMLESIGNNCFTFNPISYISFIDLPELLSVNNFLDNTQIINGIYFERCAKLNLNNDFIFPMIKKLGISDCPMLTNLPSLQNNTIESLLINVSGITILKTIGFYGCSNLKYLDIENSLIETINEFCFNYCINLETIKFPITLNEIGTNCFQGCSKLTYVEFKSYCLINTRAFSSCTSLKALDFKNKTFNKNCFDYCGFEKLDLSTVEVPLSVEIFANNSKLSEVILPRNLINIPKSIFSFCPLIENITIPATVTNIDINCFDKCDSIRYYIFESKTPPILSSTNSLYLSLIFDTKIFVPDASLELYKKATNWTFYRCDIYPISQFDDDEFNDNEKILRFTYYKSGVGYTQKDYICDNEDIGNNYVSTTKIPFFNEISANVPSIKLADKLNNNWNPELKHNSFIGYNISGGNFPITKNKVTPVGIQYGVVDESPISGWDIICVEIDTKFSKTSNSLCDFCFNFKPKGATITNPLLLEIWYSNNTSNVFYKYGSIYTYTDDNIVNLVISDLFSDNGINIIKIRFNKTIILGNNNNDNIIETNFIKFSNYTKMFIGNNVLIEKRAFLNHINLNTLLIGNYLTETTFPSYNYLPNNCFYNCKSLKYLIIPNHLNIKFHSSVFYNCNFKALVYKITDDLIIANYAFNEMNAKDFILPSKVRFEGSYNFIGCNIENFNSSIENQPITIGLFLRTKIKYFKTKLITGVEESAFDSCTIIDNLSLNFIIDDNVNTVIGINAFQNSTIKNIVLTDIKTIGNYAFRNCKKLEKIHFGDKLLSIGNNTFNNNNLSILDFPASLTSLGIETLNQNIYLRTIIFRSIVPPVLVDSNTFPMLSPIRSYKIYVPDASVDAYKIATNWVKYTDFIYPISSIPSSELE